MFYRSQNKKVCKSLALIKVKEQTLELEQNGKIINYQEY